MATVPEASNTIPPVGLDSVASRLDAHAALVAVYLALCALSLMPFVLIEHPPIVDFANHAARLSLACSAGDPVVDAMYRYNLGLIPNLAADLVNWPLCGLMGPMAVLKATIAGSLALTYFAGWLLQRKLFGRMNAFLLLLPAFAMNLVTSMGYINFLAGVGVACLMVALAIGRERKFVELLAIGNVGGLILFFCHIFALALAVVLFFGILFRDMPRNAKGFVQAGLKTLLLFVVPLLLIPFVPSADEALKIDYVGKGRAVAALFLTQQANPTIYGMLLFIPLYLAMRKGWVAVHQAMRWPLGALAFYVLVVPSGLQDAIDIDARTMIALAYLFFASLRPLHQEREITAVVGAASAALVGYALVMTVLVWQPFSHEVSELRKSMQALPAKSLVFSVTEREATTSTALPNAYGHLTSYATLDRRVFNPLEFTGIGMQPLRPTQAFARFDTPAAMPFGPETALKLADPDPAFEKKIRAYNVEFAERWPQRFDYVVYYHFGGKPNFDPARLTLIEQGSFYSILKTQRAKSAL